MNSPLKRKSLFSFNFVSSKGLQKKANDAIDMFSKAKEKLARVNEQHEEYLTILHEELNALQQEVDLCNKMKEQNGNVIKKIDEIISPD